MNRYINEASLLAAIKKEYFMLRDIRKTIANTPSIDIVWCKECKNKDTYCDYCHKLEMNIKADDFCSYGEREDQ